MNSRKNRSGKGFSSHRLLTPHEPHAIRYLKQKTSFWVAAFSLFMFVMGNMVGQHGWYAFWASVLGEGDDSLIAYTGTVGPLAEIVDYECWAKYGGDFKEHNFRQSPVECRIAPPAYEPHGHEPMISMEYMSGYHSGEEGSGLHSGVDYRVPVGTPVRSVMAARVVKVSENSPGFGTFVVLRHPNVPDPQNPSKVTTLYTTYAHLSAVYVTEGEVIDRGNVIALSGNTGKTTGPHLHFQMDRMEAPFIPYAPGTLDDGYRYTVSPVLYVQANYRAVPGSTTVVQASSSSSSVRSSVSSRVEDIVTRLTTRRQQRIEERLIAQKNREVLVAQETAPLLPSAPPAVIPKEETVASDTTEYQAGNGEVTEVSFSHDGSFTARGWEKVRVSLLDGAGNTVVNPRLPSDLKLVAAYGSAEFRPMTLSALDFVNGTAEIFILPRGRRTVVLQALPYASVSAPLRYEE